MNSAVDKSLYVLPNDQPIVSLDVCSAFSQLNHEERLYCYYLSKASWIGGLITFVQTSPESGLLFVFFHRLFAAQLPSDLKKSAIGAGFSESEVDGFFVYVCGVFSNAGNYKGFGDTKFVPNIDVGRLESLLHLSPNWDQLEHLWHKIKEPMYNLQSGKTCLGYAPHGCTTYLSSNCTAKDNETAQNWMKSIGLEPYNTRLFKTNVDGHIEYEIRLASQEIAEIRKDVCIADGITYRLTCGDYSPIISHIIQALQKATEFCANETQRKMLHEYIKSFATGSLDAHKSGSRYWVQDKAPVVESYIGFIETYRDPAGIRGEFESFVAVVNRAMSEKFTHLVNKAPEFLELLPWSSGFEKDSFLRPDFTSLDVITFAGSGIPAGINIPNYDDVKHSDGFKNVSLGNVIPASYQLTTTPFLSPEDAELMQKWRVPAFELQVGLHELLGHGSGKLLRRSENGAIENFPVTLIDPINKQTPEPCYKPGDTFDSVFGPLSSAYEECRAEAVGLYLSLEPDVLQLFGHQADSQQAYDVMYVNWLSLVWIGVGRALETWDPKRGWLQAHAQARFVLANVLIDAGVVTVTQPTLDNLLITLDGSALKTKGKKAVGDFLLHLQIYKATANVVAAKQLFDRYSHVTDKWIHWRTIILANKQPRKIFNQVNVIMNEVEQIEVKVYPNNFEGFIQSWVERFHSPQQFYDALLTLYEKDVHHFE